MGDFWDVNNSLVWKMLAVCRISIVRWIQKKPINPLRNPLLIVANLSMTAPTSLQPIRDYRMNMLRFYVWRFSLKKNSFTKTKRVFYPKLMMFFLQRSGYTRSLARRREKASLSFICPGGEQRLTWCEHANGLTSPATPGLHAHSTSTHTEQRAGRETFDTKTRCWQQQKQRWAHQSASQWQRALTALQSGSLLVREKPCKLTLYVKTHELWQHKPNTDLIDKKEPQLQVA